MGGVIHQCSCGRKYRSPVKCLCGLLASICKHRGDEVGNATCQCGAVYQCKLGQYCGERHPIDGLVEIQFKDGSPVQLMQSVNYRCCSGCELFEPSDPPAACKINET